MADFYLSYDIRIMYVDSLSKTRILYDIIANKYYLLKNEEDI